MLSTTGGRSADYGRLFYEARNRRLLVVSAAYEHANDHHREWLPAQDDLLCLVSHHIQSM